MRLNRIDLKDGDLFYEMLPRVPAFDYGMRDMWSGYKPPSALDAINNWIVGVVV